MAVTLLSGLHLTAADKRNIHSTIELLRQHFAGVVQQLPHITPDYDAVQCRVGSSPKSYRVTPCEAAPGQYTVKIAERYSNDYGRMQTRTSLVVVRVDVPPLHTGTPA